MTITEQELYILQARLTENDTWYDMNGFTYNTLSELQDCYNSHFKQIQGQDCTYQFKHVKITMTEETFTPE